jgi:vacuolar-type H+-ATPase subunit F/Vma7
MSGAADRGGPVVALGELSRLEGYALAGVDVRVAETAEEALQGWAALDANVGAVVLTRRAADALGARIEAPDSPLTVVLPE